MGLILPQTIKTKWNSKHKKYYESKGYKFIKYGVEFEVNVLDLPSTSQIKVKGICDYCGKELNLEYFRANPNMKISCKQCLPKRTKEMYGYSSPWEWDKTKDSIKKSYIKRYGVDHNFKSKECQEKRKQTFIDKYGVEFPIQNEEVKRKREKTNIERYGFKSHLSNEKIQKKKEETNLNRYGVKHIVQNKEIMKNSNERRINTLYKNGNGPCSQQQKYLHNLLGGELNYPVSLCSLDIAFPNEMLYIEYNGGGHDLNLKMNQISNEDFNTKEIHREQYLKSLDWKLIRIVCKTDVLLKDEIIIELINECKEYLNTNHNWIEINFDTKIVKCNEYERNF